MYLYIPDIYYILFFQRFIPYSLLHAIFLHFLCLGTQCANQARWRSKMIWFLTGMLAAAAPLEVAYEIAPVAGSTLYVTASELPLFASPSPDAEVLAQHATGAAVVVSDGVAPGGWVAVEHAGQTAFVQSTALTAGRVETDIDDDGEREVVLVSYDRDHSLRAQLIDGSDVSAIVLPPVRDVQGYQDLSFVETAGYHGMRMVSITVAASPMCGSGNAYLTLVHHEGALSLAARGHTFGDVPFYSSTRWSFDVPTRTAVRTHRSGDHDAGTHTVEVTLHQLDAGVFRAVEGNALEVEVDTLY